MKFTGKNKQRPALPEELQTLARWRRKNYIGTALFAVVFSIFLNQLFVLGHLTELSPKYTAVASKQFSVPLGLGLFLYGWEYQQCYTLPQLVDFALSKNLNTLISDVLAEAEDNSVVTRLLSSYGGDCVAEETLGSI